MDYNAMKEGLRQLQTWRNQIMGLGLLPPDLTALLKCIEDGPAEVERLEARKRDLQAEIATLAEQHRQDTERVQPLREEVVELQKRLRTHQEDYERWKQESGLVGA